MSTACAARIQRLWNYGLQEGKVTEVSGMPSERRFVVLNGEGATKVLAAKRSNVQRFALKHAALCKAGIISSTIHRK